MHLEAGQVIGQYTIVKRIGSGGMAVVYEATHTRLGRTVALKMMHAGFQDDPDLLRRFEREAQVVGGLDHPNIVPLYDYNTFDQTPYLVMKLVQGRTLKWHLRKRNLPLAEIGVICVGVANALTYAHERGVLHRDVKPGNIILADDDATPYLTDFGLARLLAQGESSLSIGMTVGTPHYLAPEQASGEYEVGPAADVYALGVMLYEMVVGQVPFSGESAHAVIHDQIYAPPPPPAQVNPEVPAEVEAVLLRALSKAPNERHPTPNALMQDYQNAIHVSGLLRLSEDRDEVAARSLRLLRGAAPPPGGNATPRRKITEAKFDFGGLGDDIGRRVREALTPALGEAFRGVRNELKRTAPFRRNAPYTPPTDAEAEAQMRQRAERRVAARRAWWGHTAVFMVVSLLLVVGSALSTDLVRQGIQAEVTAGYMTEAEGVMAVTWATQPWALVVVFFWLGGIAAHRAHVNNLSADREQHRQQRLEKLLAHAYGPNWTEVIPQHQYDEAASRVRRRFCNVTSFWGHLWVFLCGNVALAVGWGLTAAGLRATSAYLNETNDIQGAEVLAQLAAEPRFLLVSLAWLAILMVHMIRTVAGRHHTLEAEIGQERQLAASRSAAKGKHTLADNGPTPAVRLNSDGELTNSTADAWGNRHRRP